MLEGLLDSMRWEMTFSEMGSFWDGFFVTLQVVVAGLALSLILGTLLGVFSTTRSRVLRAISRIYVEFYQNTPLPVQVFFMYMAGPLPRRLCLRGYPYRYRIGAARPDGGSAFAGL